MKISNDQLLDIIAEASYRLHSELRTAGRENRLQEYLELIGMGDLFPKERDANDFESYLDGKILIVGKSEIKPQVIIGTFKELGIPKEQIELCLGYDEAKTYPFNKLQYNPKYRAVLFGPIPHSVVGKGESSSIITHLETNDGFPRVIRLSANNELKMTKSNLKSEVEQLLHEGYIVAAGCR